MSLNTYTPITTNIQSPPGCKWRLDVPFDMQVISAKAFLLSRWVCVCVLVVHNIVLPFVSSVCVILVCILRLTYACLCRHSRKLWS